MGDFDNYLITPMFSTIDSRQKVDISTTIADLTLRVPVISANMACLTGPKMCQAMWHAGGIGCLHRFFPVDDTIEIHNSIKVPYIASIGIKQDEYNRYRLFRKAGQKYFCIDVAHGAQQSVLDFIKYLRQYDKSDVWIMIGNFGINGTYSFINYADAFKIGIGPGEVCTTRTTAGVGCSQIDALTAHNKKNLTLCCDGGMRTPGDIAKALALGAQFVMTGSLFKGCPEAEDPFIYSGSASHESYIRQNKTQNYIAPEGITKTCDEAPSVQEIMTIIAGGIRSAMSYSNARTIEEFHDKAEVRRING